MIYLNEKEYSDVYHLEKQQYTLGGRVFMSLLSLSLKLSYFNISISVHRDETKKKEKAALAIQQEQLLQDSFKRRDHAQKEFHYLNSHIL